MNALFQGWSFLLARQSALAGDVSILRTVRSACLQQAARPFYLNQDKQQIPLAPALSLVVTGCARLPKFLSSLIATRYSAFSPGPFF